MMLVIEDLHEIVKTAFFYPFFNSQNNIFFKLIKFLFNIIYKLKYNGLSLINIIHWAYNIFKIMISLVSWTLKVIVLMKDTEKNY